MSAETPTDPPEEAAAPDAADAAPDAPKAAKAKAKASKAAKPAKAASKAAKKAKDADAEPQGESATEDEPAAKKAPAKKASKKPAAEKKPAEAASEKPAKPAAAPRAAKASGKPRRRVVAAHARHVRTSARKARMVCGHLRGKSIEEARAILAFTPREVARDWSKLLESAVANAENNHELVEDDLIVREAYADEGPTIKRFQPRAMGRASPIRKRTSHLTIKLTPRPEPGTTKRHG
jgi:ribosomal protein L22